ncbi:hypothetical protein P7C70_g4306, partial [Phenoliferia sp. Uapishka_3]
MYPSIFLYVDGEFFEQFTGKRSLEVLSAYVESHTPETIEAETIEAETIDTPKIVEKLVGKTRLKQELTLVEDDLEEPTALELIMGTKSSPPDQPPSPPTPSPAAPSSERPQFPPPTVPKPGFIAQPHVEGEKRENSDDGIGSPDGNVHTLEADDVAAMKAKGAGPAFVKYFAPWCGHCKTLAPKWKDLAVALKGQVNVYEVDCDDSRNKRVCRNEGIAAFPTLVFYNEGAKVEYKGRRDLPSMKSFASKAASSTAVRAIANEYELKRASTADDVLFLFLHPADTAREEVTLVQDASKSLLAGPPFYVSSSPDLFSLFSLSAEARILVFKDHSLTPSLSFSLPPATLTARARTDLILEWLRVAKLALVTELTGASFSDLMPSTGNPPLVGLVVLSPKKLGAEGLATTLERVVAMAKGWNERLVSGKHKGTRPVIWSWVDGDKWGSWTKSLYGIKASEEPVVVIADSKALTYWKTGINDVQLSISGETVYELIEDGVFPGTLKPQSSRNFVERLGSDLAIKAVSLRDSAIDHPLVALFLSALAMAGVWSMIKWILADPTGDGARLSGSYAKLE